MEPNKLTETHKKLVGIPARQLTQEGLAVCFFPEQPERKLVEVEVPVAIPIDDTPQIPVVEEIIQKTERKEVEAVSYFRPRKKETTPQPETKPKSKQKSKTPSLESITKGEDDENQRMRWKNKLCFIASLASFSLSLNNVCNFPLQIYRFGGSFLVPYTIFSIVIGYPTHVLQASFGQYSQRGIIKFWDCAPVFRGVGVAMFLSCLVVSLYYNMFAAYALVYLSRCFNRHLPWTNCTNINVFNNTCVITGCVPNISLDPASHYFFNNILNTPHDGRLGGFKWWLFLSLVFTWFVVYVITIHSARTIEKASMFLTGFVYVAFTLLLIVAFETQDHDKVACSYDHISQQIARTCSRIFSIELWTASATQVLLELGVVHGVPLTYSSYCNQKNFIFTDSAYIVFLNYLHSIIFTVLFSFFGSSKLCLPGDISKYGLGMVFILFSERVGRISAGHFWCILFFLMIFCTVILSQIAITETILLNFYEYFLELLEFRWIVNLIFCLCCLIIGSIFCFANGYFMMNFIHVMPLYNIILPIIVLFLVGILFNYGYKVYYSDMKDMTKSDKDTFENISPLFHIIFGILVLLLILSVAIINDKIYHWTIKLLGWIIIGFIIVPAVLWIVVAEIILKRKKSDEDKNEKGNDDWVVYRRKVKKTAVSDETSSLDFSEKWRKDKGGLSVGSSLDYLWKGTKKAKKIEEDES